MATQRQLSRNHFVFNSEMIIFSEKIKNLQKNYVFIANFDFFQENENLRKNFFLQKKVQKSKKNSTEFIIFFRKNRKFAKIDFFQKNKNFAKKNSFCKKKVFLRNFFLHFFFEFYLTRPVASSSLLWFSLSLSLSPKEVNKQKESRLSRIEFTNAP